MVFNFGEAESSNPSFYRHFPRRLTDIIFTLALLFLLSTGSAAAASTVIVGQTISSNGSYVLNSDWNSTPQNPGITITASDVTFDGRGYRLDASSVIGTQYGIRINPPTGTTLQNITIKNVTLTGYWDYGIHGTRATNVTIEGNNISDFSGYSSSGRGVYLNAVNDSSIRNNTVDGNQYRMGISILSSQNNTISNNTVTNQTYDEGLFLDRSLNQTLTGNHLSANEANLRIKTSTTSQYDHTIDITNTVGTAKKPLHYYFGQSNIDLGPGSNAGTVQVFNATNVTVRSLDLEPNNWDGLLFRNVTNATVENVNASGNSYSGFEVVDSSNVSILNSTASSNFQGIYLSSTDNSTVENATTDGNTVYDPTGTNHDKKGVHLENSHDNRVLNGTSSDNSGYGIYLDSSSNNVVSDNNASSNKFSVEGGSEGWGITLSSSDNNTLKNNTADENTIGIDISNSDDNLLQENTADANSYSLPQWNGGGVSGHGIKLQSSDRNTFKNNSALSNTYGFHLSNSNNNTLTNGNATNNTYDFYSGSAAVDNDVTDLHGTVPGSTISFTGEEFYLSRASSIPNDPTGKENIGHYVAATATSQASSWLQLNFSYTAPDARNVNESSLRVWRYNNSWNEVNGTNGVNTGVNEVYAKIQNFSLFAPLGDYNSTKIDNDTYQFNVPNATANETEEFTMPETDSQNESWTKIDSIGVTPNKNTSLNVTVNTSKEKPRQAKEFKASAGLDSLLYFNITHPGLTNDEISNVTFRFRVEKSVLESKGLTPADVSLQRHHGGEWNEVPTEKVDEEPEEYVFEATSPGLSMLAVVVKTKSKVKSDVQTNPPGATVPSNPSSLSESNFLELFKEHTVASLSPGDVSTVDFPEDSQVQSIDATVTSQATDPSYATGLYRSRPDGVAAVGGEVYGYVGVASSLSGSQVDTVSVRLKAPASWFEEKGLEPSSAKVQQWNGDDWVGLDTELVAEKGSEVLVDAESDGFSTLALTVPGDNRATADAGASASVDEGGAASETQEPGDDAGASDGSVGTSGPDSGQDGGRTGASGESGNTSPGFGAAASLGAIISLLFLSTRLRRGRE